MQKKIFIIEDDKTLCNELSILLEKQGYLTEKPKDFETLPNQMLSSDADLFLLDITLPGQNGEFLLRDFRSRRDTPVIMLTSRTEELDEVLSMSYGADDYITKPYNPTLLLLRISAVLKRSSKGTSASHTYRGVEVSTLKGSLLLNGREEVLTKNEMIIFNLLFEKQGEIVSRDELMTVLWDNDEFLNDNALSVNISRLRSKLAELGLPDAIETRKKQGYVLK
ncbi:MAG: response regulator transcription factor [Lachnospiraceae bacterium]|nr:response regulator transcription factor [Lachnospiraceae bacterium]